MTDQKRIRPNSEIREKEFSEPPFKLDEAMEHLNSLPPATPNQQWFEQLVLDEQEALRKRYRRELTLFILSALFILSVVLFVMRELPQIFLVLQGAVSVFAFLYSYKETKKQVERL